MARNGRSHKRIKGRGGKRKFPTVSRDPDSKIFTTSFRIFVTNAASVTGGTFTNVEIDLSPANFGARGVAFADLYSLWRPKNLQVRVHFHPGYVTTATQSQYMPGNCSWALAVMYVGIATFTAPTLMTNFVDFPHFTYGNDRKEGMMMRINQNDFKKHRVFNWYHTATTGSGANEIIPMSLEIGSVPYGSTTTAAGADYVIDMEVEFTGPVDPALIPATVLKRHGVEDMDLSQFEVKQRVHVAPSLSEDLLVVERKEQKEKTGVDLKPVLASRNGPSSSGTQSLFGFSNPFSSAPSGTF